MYNPPGQKLYETPLMLQLIALQPSLGPSLLKVAHFILRYPLQAAALNIEDLGLRTHTSTAAVNRLATSMGLRGFTGLHAALVENLMNWVAPAEKVRSELERHPEQPFSLEQQVRLSKGNLDGVMDSNPEGVFEAVVEALAGARHIYVLGFGNSHHLAGLFCDWLIPYCNSVTAVSTGDGLDISAHKIAALGPEDALIVIALPTYNRESVHLASFARSAGATVLAVTDSPVSPLATIAHATLYAPPAHPLLANSKGAVLAVIEALAASLHQRQLPRVKHALNLAERALAYIYGDTAMIDLSTHGSAVSAPAVGGALTPPRKPDV